MKSIDLKKMWEEVKDNLVEDIVVPAPEKPVIPTMSETKLAQVQSRNLERSILSANHVPPDELMAAGTMLCDIARRRSENRQLAGTANQTLEV